MSTKVISKLFSRLLFSVILASGASTTAATVNVDVGSNFFSPNNININVGDTVEWSWSSGFHTVTSDDNSAFDSGARSAPSGYSFTFSAAGSYPYYCQVHSLPGRTGQNGNVNVQSANNAPTVSITLPASNAIYLYSPTNITVNATANDSDGSVSSVVIQLDGNNRATLTQAPFNTVLSNVGAGAHTITAIATDNVGAQTTTSVNIVVNSQPSASVTAPQNNSVIATTSNITITATGSDSDGTLSQLQIFSNGNLLGTSGTSPFSLSFAPPTNGIYTLTATATDNRGASTSSAIQINATTISLGSFKVQNNQFQFKVSGLVAPKSFVLQGASLLASPVNWVGLKTNVAGSTTFDFIDSDSSSLSLRYYRVIELP
jgi:plastocyanin